MRALRRRSSPVLGVSALVPGLAASFLLLSSQPVAYQDLVSHLAKRAGADQTWRRHVASLVRPSTTVAGFVFNRPIPRDPDAPRLVMASLSMETAGDLRRAGPRPGPALGAGMDRAVLYPVPNREAKGDLLLAHRMLRPSIGSLQPAPGLPRPADDLTEVAPSIPATAEESADTGHSPLALGGMQLASVSPSAVLDDRSPVARLGMAVPLVGDGAGLAADEGVEGRRFAA